MTRAQQVTCATLQRSDLGPAHHPIVVSRGKETAHAPIGDQRYRCRPVRLLSGISHRSRSSFCTSDYYWLDGIFYAEADPIFGANTTYAKSIAVAIEHENLSADSQREMNKLQLQAE